MSDSDYIKKMQAKGWIQHKNGVWYDPAPVKPNVEPSDKQKEAWDRMERTQNRLYSMDKTTDWR